MGKPWDAAYKTGGSFEDRLNSQDISRGKASVSGITKIERSTDQGMDQDSNRIRGSDWRIVRSEVIHERRNWVQDDFGVTY